SLHLSGRLRERLSRRGSAALLRACGCWTTAEKENAMSKSLRSMHVGMRSLLWRAISLILASFLLPALIFGQLTTGTITGTFSDSSGPFMPGVNFLVKNVDTGLSRTIVTGDTGRYEASNLPVGKYEVTASISGFQTSVRTGIELTIGRN